MSVAIRTAGGQDTTDQSPRWEGPEEMRPCGYLTAKVNPDADRDAVNDIWTLELGYTEAAGLFRPRLMKNRKPT